MGGCYSGMVALWGLPARVAALEVIIADQHETFDVLAADVAHVEERVNGLGAYIERSRSTAPRRMAPTESRWPNRFSND